MPERPVTLSTSACNKTSMPSSFISSSSASRHVRIFPVEKARAALDDRDAAAEPPHRLGEFQADVAAAEDDEVVGQAFQVQGFDVRHRPGGGEPGHVGNAGAGADVDEDTLAPQQPRAAGVQRHLHRFRFREPRLAHDQLRAAGLELAEVQLHHPRRPCWRLRRATPAMSTRTDPVTTPRPLVGWTSETALAL